MLDTGTSEVAYFRREQFLQEQAAQQGLSGLAVVASHEMITARMQRGAERILRLIQEGRYEEAQVLMSTDGWYLEEKEASDEQASDGHELSHTHAYRLESIK